MEHIQHEMPQVENNVIKPSYERWMRIITALTIRISAIKSGFLLVSQIIFLNIKYKSTNVIMKQTAKNI